MAVATLSPARALRRPRRADPRALIGVFLTLAALVAYVRMDDNVYRAALPADVLESLVGRQLGEPIHAQQVLARAQVAEQPGLAADQVAMTIPAKPESAVDGRLRPGDLIQVLLT